MDSALYKDFTTSRGYNYHYYNSPAQDSKITLLFCHGFPSLSRDWRFVVPFFQAQGYGIIAPDMLGYGGTEKPTDPAAYVKSKMAKDIIDILDEENVKQVIAIGHDWGSVVVARLANYYPERFLAYAFLAVPYTAPNPNKSNYDDFVEVTKKILGYENFGYQLFFDDDISENIINAHWDTFLDLLFPADPEIWKTHIGPRGSMQTSLESDYRGPCAPFFTEEERKLFTEIFQKNGIFAPTCWYKVAARGLDAEDNKQIPLSRYLPPTSSPMFYAAGKKDAVGAPALGYLIFQQPGFKDHQVTIKELEGDHWFIFSHADEINKELDAWIKSALASAKSAL